MKGPHSFWAAALFGLVGGCASILGGTSQTIAIDSNPPGAQCQMLREGAAITSFVTPSSVVVDKTEHDIQIRCSKPGYQLATKVLTADPGDGAWDDTILDDLLGWAIDSPSGTGNRYAGQLTVTMVPSEPGQSSPELPTAAAGLANFGIVLASFETVAQAEQGWDVYLQRFPVLVGSRSQVSPVTADDGRTVFNLYGAGFSQAESEQICRQIESAGSFCAVVQFE